MKVYIIGIVVTASVMTHGVCFAEVPSASAQYGQTRIIETKVIPPAPIIRVGQIFEEIALVSGEKIHSAKFLGAGSSGAAFAIERKIRTIPFAQLPQELASSCAEFAQHKEAADAARTDAAIRFEQSQKEKRDAAYAERLSNAEAQRQADEREQKAKEEEALNTREGLKLVGTSCDGASAYVELKNVTTSLQAFHWRNMKARFRGGEVRDATDCVTNDKKFGMDIEPGQTRIFQVAFGQRIVGDGRWLEDISWAEGDWMNSAERKKRVTQHS